LKSRQTQEHKKVCKQYTKPNERLG